jgi:NitT/TauT family transport system ATP-binding protein
VSVIAQAPGQRAVHSPRPVSGAGMALTDVSISFGDFRAVAGIDLDVRPGEFLCLLGPSGCGKSTLLSAMAGFVPTSAGTLTAEGTPLVGGNRNAGVVFQSSEALFDWLTVRQNVAFGPRMRGASRGEQQRIADEYLSLVGLSHARGKYPPQLSGGMRQRVQIARVLANQPRIVLMDEPFGALDAQTREVLQRELDRIWRTSGCTVVFVTHDIDEAIVLGDRIVVMTAGPAAGIKTVRDVDLPRPRSRTDPDVIALYEELREEIGAEVREALRGQGLEADL